MGVGTGARGWIVEGAQPPGEGVPDHEFRALMARFPSGVCVVTTVDGAGLPRGLTCSSLASVTLRPPTLLVCLNQASRTFAAIRDAGGFAVNLLHARGLRAAEVFATPHVDRFAAVGWRPSPRAGLPWLVDDAFAFADCAVTAVHPVGDHAVVLGSVTAVHGDEDVPLLYGMRQYSAWCPAGVSGVPGSA